MAWAIAVVSLSGRIPDGSAGRDHADYILQHCLGTMGRLEALCLILDFRDVDYLWGNSLLGVFDRLNKYLYYEWHDVDMWLPMKFLASDRSAGLYSLLNDRGLFFASIEEAVVSCEADLKRWREE